MKRNIGKFTLKFQVHCSIIFLTDQQQQNFEQHKIVCSIFLLKMSIHVCTVIYYTIVQKMFDMIISSQKFATWKFPVCGTACTQKANTEYRSLQIFHS